MRTDIELLRIVSALGVVWYHSSMSYGRELAYAGLVVFVILSVFLAGVSSKNHSVWSRSVKLLVPCALWSCFYGVLNFARGFDVLPQGLPFIHQVLTTPAVHLWYLPFIFIALLCVGWLKYFLNPLILSIVATALTGALLVSSPIWREWELVSPFAQYLHALPAIFIGLAFSQYGRLGKEKYILIAGLFLSVFYTASLDIVDVSLTYCVGVCCSAILLLKRSVLPKIGFVYGVSKLTLGIYLLHPFIILICSFVGLSGLVVPLLSFLVSTALIFVSMKWLPRPLSKYVF